MLGNRRKSINEYQQHHNNNGRMERAFSKIIYEHEQRFRKSI